jgi:ABC-type transport system substrate-binding protein
MKYTYKFLLALFSATLFILPLLPPTLAAGTLFKATLIAPGTANLLRRQWGIIIANSYQAVGIDAHIAFLGWTAVYDRVLYPPRENLGKVYDDGGYDIELIGITPGLFPLGGIFQYMSNKNFAPAGSNYYLWNDSISEAYINTFMAKGYTAEGITAFKNWQAYEFDQVPRSIIAYQAAPIAAAPDINFQGYEWLYDNVAPVPQFIKTSKTSVVFAQTGEIVALNPPLSSSWYDFTIFSPIFEGANAINAKNEFTSALTTGLTISADGRDFTYTLRHGVKWQDGIEVTADDFVFSLLANMNPNDAAANAGLYCGFVGEDVAFKWMNGTTTRLVFDPGTGEGFYPANGTTTRTRKAFVTAVDKYTVKVTLADFDNLGIPTGIWHPEGDQIAWIPKHVLETVPWADWSTHPFNTGVGTYTANGQTWSGPMGTGPYEWVAYDSVTGTVHLKKFSDYWNKTALEAAGMFGIEDYYVKFIVAKDPAIAALKNGEADILDQNYQLQLDVKAGTFAGWATVYNLEGTGIQEVGYNMQHPILGTGTATPLGTAHPDQAALAAKYVRQALDYLIPRQLIIDSLLAGYGTPASVPNQPSQLAFNSSIVARDYNPAAAKSLLAAAGYATGVPPPSTSVSSTSLLLGNPLTFSGHFVVDPEIGITSGGFVALLQESMDNSTWTAVAQTITTTGGFYTFSYQPKAAGTFYYEVVLTGVGADVAAASSAIGPDFPYSGLTKAVDEQTSPVTRITVTTLDAVLQPLKDDIATLQSQVATLQSTVSSLSSQLSTLTTLTYALGGLIVVVAILAYYLFTRKKAE